MNNKNFIKILLTAAIFAASIFLFSTDINAEENFDSPPDFQISGTVEGENVHFEITDSEYLNIVLDSSEPIKLKMESIPEMLTMIIESSSSTSATSTQITLSGFASSTTYYKYQDDYHNLTEFISDENGRYSFIQDISNPHSVFIQPRHSTKLIRDNSTGGDCYLIGNWDYFAKTCTLTMDLNEGIWFGNNNLTLDGNGHTITGSNTGIGVYLNGYYNQGKGIAVNNLNIKNFSYGIYLWYTSDSNSFINNTIFNNYYGVASTENKYNNFSNNTFSNNNYDINLSYVNYYQIYNNNFINNSTQARVYYFWPYWQTNVFSGNYWNNYDEPIEGCNDSDNNRICDSPYVFDMGRDNTSWIIKDGWKNQPPNISNVNQYKSDGVTPISEGGITTEDIVVFKANLSDSDNDQIKLQIELKEFNQSFDEQNLLESFFAPSGSEITLTKEGLIDGQYKWRARVVDDKGNKSDWQEFGQIGNVDFEVKLPLSYKAANLAKELVYQPYLWGGKGWDYNQDLFVSAYAIKTGYNYYNPDIKSVDIGIGVDCSGLVMWVYNRSFDPLKSRFNNFVKAEGADEQYRYNTAVTTELELKPGDVMFFDWDANGFMDHIAMYVGDGGGFDVVNARSRELGIMGMSKDILKILPGFIVFKRVVPANPLAILITSHSPVDLAVTDPDGFAITPTTIVPSDVEFLREITGVLYYSEMNRGPDGNPIDQIYSYIAKVGDYTVQVLPAPGALPTETYSLDFKAGEQTTILAQNIPLSQSPRQGYGITTSATGVITTFIPVAIDIKPGSYPNSINLGSNGVVPVAIFGSATFDVGQIDYATINLANASVKLKGNG